MWKWIAGIIGSIISGLVVYHLTEGGGDPSTGNGNGNINGNGYDYYCYIAETSEECPTSSKDLFGECDCGNPNQTGIVTRYK